MDENSETFVVYVASLSSTPLDVHLSCRPQISGLIVEEAPTKISDKFVDFADMFSSDLASELSEHTGINDHAIKLVDGQKPPYGPIYSLGPVELKTLKAYIETNLANRFFSPSKLTAGAPILFDRKLDGFLRFYIDYRDLNNLTIRNRYPLPLVRESLNRLRRTWQFIQLNFTSAYHQIRIRKGDKWKTAFRTWYGHLEYQVMLFGLTNAPASFQRYINKILVEKFDIFVIVYLDNIFIYTDDNRETHVATIQWVLE